jgi:hypothetical protein
LIFHYIWRVGIALSSVGSSDSSEKIGLYVKLPRNVADWLDRLHEMGFKKCDIVSYLIERAMDERFDKFIKGYVMSRSVKVSVKGLVEKQIE